ncbi:MAG: hypothetical protein DHS20C11_04210 [Lysobacteraceae bacterium]|nr:MAG: hypothetical protein DHS20C11_04210 [Xanthomonadaceae bacterium]
MRVKRIESECPKALDPAERLATDGKAGGCFEVNGLAKDGCFSFATSAHPCVRRRRVPFKALSGMTM